MQQEHRKQTFKPDRMLRKRHECWLELCRESACQHFLLKTLLCLVGPDIFEKVR